MTHGAVVESLFVSGEALTIWEVPDCSLPAPALMTPPSFVSAVNAALASVTPRQAQAFRLYCGIDAAPHTLDEVGQLLGVTRERSRQLHEMAWKRLISADPQIVTVADRVSAILSDRTTPLALLELSAADAWLDGIEEVRTLLAYALERTGDGTLRCWDLDGQPIVTRCKPEAWGKLRASARAFLRDACEQGIKKQAAWAELERRARAAGTPELTGALWESIVGSPYDGADEILHALGTSQSARVRTILRGASAPMTLVEFARALGEEHRLAEDGYAFANRLRTDITASGGLLFGRSLYGRADHLTKSEHEMDAIVAEVEFFLQEGDSVRQWHAKELLAMLGEERPDLVQECNAFELSLILRRSTVLRYHKRLIWSLRDAEGAPSERLEVVQLCEQALEQRGAPMSTQELIMAIRKVRGLNDAPQLTPNGRLFRISPGTWGLLDRDIVSSENEADALMDRLKAVLDARQTGLHLSELEEALYSDVEVRLPRLDAHCLWGLAQRDPRITCTYGWLLGLSGWESTRRLTNIEAAKRVSELGMDRLTTDQVHALLEQFAQRSISQRSVSALMTAAGYTFDADSRTYRPGDPGDTDDGAD